MKGITLIGPVAGLASFASIMGCGPSDSAVNSSESGSSAVSSDHAASSTTAWRSAAESSTTTGSRSASTSSGTRVSASASTSTSTTSVSAATSVNGTSATSAVHHDAGPAPCVAAGTCPAGTWINVTPANANLKDGLSCGNYGTQSVGVDPQNPANLYAEFNCQGIWKSTDYGATWTGPINTGNNGATVGNCAGGITVADGGHGNPPTLYQSCIRGATGFWASTDGGVNWTSYPLAPLPGNRQDVYPPAVDPNDSRHLVMTGHEQNYVVESHDGGHTWTNVPMNAGMMEDGGTGFAFFVNTGDATTTAGTWLWTAQASGGMYGTWRTDNHGATWTRVDANEHPHGASQVYNAGQGVVYMAGMYSALGWGVLRSQDYGKTWAHVGSTAPQACVWGTAKNVYAGYGWADGLTASDPTNFELAPEPAATGWASQSTPTQMVEGPAQVATTSDGSHSILVGAMWQAGIWTYLEP
jgi:hypothetical protein